jgi:serine/threonine protein kinase
MPLRSGETFAGFRVIRVLGPRGMGEVYPAEHPRLPRRDALKVLPNDVSADPDYRARFNREADLASKLWHPHIVRVHDRGEYNGRARDRNVNSMGSETRKHTGKILYGLYPSLLFYRTATDLKFCVLYIQNVRSVTTSSVNQITGQYKTLTHRLS